MKYSESQLLMGTIIRVDVCYLSTEEEKLRTTTSKVWQRLSDISRRMSVFEKDSDIDRINHSAGEIVSVGADTVGLIKDSQQFWAKTNKTFDVTVFPLIQLWKDAEKNGQLPTRDDLKKAQKSLGILSVEFLDQNRIRLQDPLVNIDLGGIAKGFGVDEAARILKEDGFKDFLIDAGGDMYANGSNCQRKSWRIGIRDPRDSEKILGTITLSDMAVTTSGDYERYYEINGQRWSHIINPLTGYPQKGVVSATVIAPTAEQADAFSTALCVLGGRAGVELIDSLGDSFAAFVIESDDGKNIIKYQSKNYIKFKN